MSVTEGIEQEPFSFFLAKRTVTTFFKGHLITVSFTPKEMSKTMMDKLCEMEGRSTCKCLSFCELM